MLDSIGIYLLQYDINLISSLQLVLIIITPVFIEYAYEISLYVAVNT